MEATTFAAPVQGGFSLDFTGCYTALDDPFLGLGDALVGVHNDQLAIGALDEMMPVSDSWLYPPQAPQPTGPPQPRVLAVEVHSGADAAVPDVEPDMLTPASTTAVTTRGAPVAVSWRTATNEDWIRFRHVITKLYMGENYTLSQVQAVMREKHSVHAR